MTLLLRESFNGQWSDEALRAIRPTTAPWAAAFGWRGPKQNGGACVAFVPAAPGVAPFVCGGRQRTAKTAPATAPRMSSEAPESENYGAPPLVTSAPLAWQGVQVEQYSLGPMELPAHHRQHHVLMVYQTAGVVHVQQRRGRRLQEGTFQTNDLGLYPGGEYGRIGWDARADNIQLLIDDAHLEQVARQGLDLARFSLHEAFRFADPFLAQLGRQLLAAAGRQHALGLLYVESLTNTLCHHLIEHHADHAPRPAPGRALSGAVLARIDAYLEAAADEAVTLETLASLANLSVFHFARLFKAARGVSPYQYVLHGKICRAQALLRAGELPLAAISDALGFASPASFAAAFKRAVGRSPQKFQRG